MAVKIPEKPAPIIANEYWSDFDDKFLSFLWDKKCAIKEINAIIGKNNIKNNIFLYSLLLRLLLLIFKISFNFFLNIMWIIIIS